ncbi:MAG: hypothetical protein JWN44_5676 [Myxococcales bacterium]|nr:hypothetical protein [Myxococcales bacterium]
MTRVFSWGSALVLISLFGGCYSDHRVGDNSLTTGDGGTGAVQMVPAASVQLAIDGMTFQAGCPNGHSGVGFRSGGTGTCGPLGATGAGPVFMTLQCYDTPMQQMRPVYMIGTLFRNFNPGAGVGDDTTFDLSDPDHEQYITVMLGNQDLTGTEYQYCSAPPQDLADGGTYPASSGTVTVHHFVPDPGAPQGVFIADVELSNVVVPSVNGGPTMKVVSAHLYFQ